jgi:hypothetical protein
MASRHLPQHKKGFVLQNGDSLVRKKMYPPKCSQNTCGTANTGCRPQQSSVDWNVFYHDDCAYKTSNNEAATSRLVLPKY